MRERTIRRDKHNYYDLLYLMEAFQLSKETVKQCLSIEYCKNIKDTWYVNENGVYAMAFKSEQKDCEQLRKWVYHKGIPDSVQDGGFMMEGGNTIDCFFEKFGLCR